MVERVKKILETFRLSPSQLAETLNVQRSNISHILSGRNKPSLDLIQKILTEFPELNSDWLLFGKGDMKKSAKAPEATKADAGPKATEPKKAAFPPTREIKPTKDTPVEENPAEELPMPQESALSKQKIAIQKNTSNKKSGDNDKSIERIIILNDDNTFKEYKPE